MNFTKQGAYIHRARQKQEGELDIVDKFRIIKILREQFGLHGLTGEIVMISEDKCRCPDILIKTKLKPIIIELDGLCHGEPQLPTKKTVKRNDDYEEIGILNIIINKEETKDYREDLVIEKLKKSLQMI